MSREIKLTDRHKVKYNGFQFVVYEVTTPKGEKYTLRGEEYIADKTTYRDIGAYPTLRLACKCVALSEFTKAIELHSCQEIADKFEEMVEKKFDDNIKHADLWLTNKMLR